MGSTHWRHAGLSLILDNSGPGQARAHFSNGRPHKWLDLTGHANFTYYEIATK
jgi:hypothetical protein